jgi:GrpB-like predicted nucleotidyltransferase (UPF0157 family)
MTNANEIVVADYSPEWPRIFEDLKRVYVVSLGNLILEIHHVGSTSIPGLAAKPVIDIDLVIEDRSILPEVISRLAPLGYEHRGDLGIPDREAFGRVSEQVPLDGSGRIWLKHNLYCCHRGCVPLRNHLALRDYLRTHPEKAHEYGELKKRLAAEVQGDIDLYIERKSSFILGALREMGFGGDDLRSIAEQNKKP